MNERELIRDMYSVLNMAEQYMQLGRVTSKHGRQLLQHQVDFIASALEERDILRLQLASVGTRAAELAQENNELLARLTTHLETTENKP